MLNRLRNAWRIAGMADAIVVDRASLSSGEEEKALKEPGAVVTPLGDGGAVFFGEPTEKERLDHERSEAGTLPWYERLKDL